MFEQYEKLGIPVVRLHKGEKRPYGPRWQENVVSDAQTIGAWIEAGYGIGILLGPQGGYIDIECDTQKAEQELQDLFAHQVPATPTWRGLRGKHRLFQWDDRLPPKAKFLIGEIEWRIGGGGKASQSVLPPSVVHYDLDPENGIAEAIEHTREWVEGLEIGSVPIAKLPECVLTKVLAILKEKESKENKKGKQFVIEDSPMSWAEKYKGDLSTLDVEKLCEDRMVGRIANGIKIKCPWPDEHNSGDKYAYVFAPSDNHRYPNFYCHHTHGEQRNGLQSLLELYDPAFIDSCCAKHFPRAQAVPKDLDFPAIENVPVFCADIQCTRPKDLIKDVLARGCKGLITSGSKDNKTWNLLGLGDAASKGEPWLGLEMAQACKVLFLNFEIPRGFMRDRLLALTKNPSPNWDMWNLRGKACSVETLNKIIIDKIISKNYDLIILDPLYMLTGNLDENSNKDMTVLFNSLEEICQQTGATLMMSHHHTKGKQAGKIAKDRPSGAGVFARGSDVMLDFVKHEVVDCWTVNFTLRFHAPKAPIVVRWVFPRFELAPDLDPMKLADLQQGGRPAKYNIFDFFAEGCTKKAWLKNCLMNTDMAAGTFDAQFKKASLKNLISIVDDQIFLISRFFRILLGLFKETLSRRWTTHYIHTDNLLNFFYSLFTINHF